MKLAIIAAVALLFAGCGQEDTFLGTWVNTNDVELEIVSMDPCEVHFEMENGDIMRSYETGAGAGDDGTYDWSIMENSGGGMFGLKFPRNTYSHIEMTLFDDNDGIAFKDDFFRPE